MSNEQSDMPGRWMHGELPKNVQAGVGTVITGEGIFRRFFSQRQPAAVIGEHCTLEGVQFAIGRNGQLTIGNYCYFSHAVLLCEESLRIGNYVMLSWNVTIADTDFHPVAPAERILDAIACSPLGQGRARPAIPRLPVIIDDDVWVGPCVTILKGVHIGAGAFIEAGSLVTRDVPARARILGNPAQIIGTV